MEGCVDGAGLKRLIVAALLALAFAAGYAAGVRADRPAAPAISDEYVPSGPDLWRTLPPELLSNVVEGKMEEISKLEDDIARIRTIQENKMATAQMFPDE